MNKPVYALNDLVIMKKAHPCGENKWQIIRMGADIRIKCINCGRSILLSRHEFDRKLKKVIEENN